MSTLLAVWLMWDALTGASPPAQGYRLYYGPNPGQQTISKDAGNVNLTEVTGLPIGIPIYFVCRAYNEAGESGPSNEVVWVEQAPPTPTPTPLPQKFLLAVSGGTGDGFYRPGLVRAVKAASPTTQYRFVRWECDIPVLADPFSPATTLQIPERDVEVKAIFQRQ